MPTSNASNATGRYQGENCLIPLFQRTNITGELAYHMAGASSVNDGHWFGAERRARCYNVFWAIGLIFASVAPSYGNWLVVSDRAPVRTPYGVTAEVNLRTISDVFGAEARASGVAPCAPAVHANWRYTPSASRC